MTAYAALSLPSLIDTSNDRIIDRLLRSDSVSGFTQVPHNQIIAWRSQLDLLRAAVASLIVSSPQTSNAHLVLEYRIPRREKRIDAVILLKHTVILIEFKVGSSREAREDVDQLLDYALDIAYYHAESSCRRLVPVLCATEVSGTRFGPSSDNPSMESLVICGGEGLSSVLEMLVESDARQGGTAIVAEDWVKSAYRPVPGVVEATVQLFRAHNVEDIKSALAGEERISATVAHIDQIIGSARARDQKVLCLITGVPGAGKTLAGLQIAHLEETLKSDWHTVFISGNGPLLKVLRAALTRDYAKHEGIALTKAKTHAASLLHSVHAYLAEATSRSAAPVERIVVFDEAQRAWDAAKMQKMSGRAQRLGAADLSSNRPENSEPWQILEVLERHQGGAVVVALCGNGQEIHDGEAGISEWIAARDKGFPAWQLLCSPIAAELSGIDARHSNTTLAPELHLEVPVRAHRARSHTQWVDAVLRGSAEEARQYIDEGVLPIFLTRNLEAAREWLWKTTLGTRRCGLLASSSGARLRPYGIEVTSDFRKGVDYTLWFTADRNDLRSSNALEVAATEFECQGLELDRVGVCWSWDMPIRDGRPTPQSFRGSAWSQVRGQRECRYIENKYRVLLTRAREGMVIWVPAGREADTTRKPAEADAIADYLRRCGLRELEGAMGNCHD